MKLLPFTGAIPAPGDAERLEDLVPRLLLENLSCLYSSAYRLCGETSLAEDFVQETARKALEGASTLRHRRHVRAWLFKILTNVARDHFRRHHSWEESDAADEDMATVPDVLVLPEATAHDVRKALGQLSNLQRAIILLIDIDDFTLTEASEMLQIPVGTAASRLARARKELQRQLSAYRSERVQNKRIS